MPLLYFSDGSSCECATIVHHAATYHTLPYDVAYPSRLKIKYRDQSCKQIKEIMSGKGSRATSIELYPSGCIKHIRFNPTGMDKTYEPSGQLFSERLVIKGEPFISCHQRQSCCSSMAVAVENFL